MMIMYHLLRLFFNALSMINKYLRILATKMTIEHLKFFEIDSYLAALYKAFRFHCL